MATGSTKDPLLEAESKAIANRLRRLEGQVRGLQRMIESGEDCEAVLTQVNAAKAALDQVGLRIVAHAMKTCGPKGGSDEFVDEALKVFLKYVNCVR